MGIVHETPRLVLRPLLPSDADAMFIALGDPEVCRYWSSPAHENVEQTRAMLEPKPDAPYSTWAITGPLGDEALGWVYLGRVRDGVGELGYILRRQQWGHGYAGEGVAAIIDHAFSAEGMHRLMADIDPRNAGSIRLVERLGFAREGLLRENWVVAGERCDSVIYGLLEHQWRAGADERDGPRPDRA